MSLRPKAPPEPDEPIQVNIAEVKARFSEYVRTAEAGQRVVVTSYGRPVADLVPHRKTPELGVRPATRPWGSVKLPRTGRGRTDSLALLMEERRKR